MSDKEDADKKPLKNVRIDVDVEPRDRHSGADKSISKKAEQRIKEAVKEAVEKKKNDGSDSQFKEADKALNKERDQIPKKNIKRVKVRVQGEREDDRGKTEKVVRERDVTPGD